MVAPAMRVKAIRQILKVCNDAVGARVLAVASMKGKPMVDICWIAIDKLTPNGRNARTHSGKQNRQIADSIEAGEKPVIETSRRPLSAQMASSIRMGTALNTAPNAGELQTR